VYNSTSTNSNLFIKIGPSEWVYPVIWSPIYVLQGIILLYGVATTCIRWRKSQGYLYNSPAILPYYFFITYLVNVAAIISWIFLYGRRELIASTVVITIVPIVLYICSIISQRALERVGPQLMSEGMSRHIWFVRILVHNGLAFYATWVTIAAYLNIAIAMVYRGNVSMDVACWTALILLNVTVALWFILETFVYDRYLRYTFAPYIVLLIALSGSLEKNYDPAAPASFSIYTAVFLGFSALLGLVKVAVMVSRHIKHPILYNGRISHQGAKGDIPM